MALAVEEGQEHRVWLGYEGFHEAHRRYQLDAVEIREIFELHNLDGDLDFGDRVGFLLLLTYESRFKMVKYMWLDRQYSILSPLNQ